MLRIKPNLFSLCTIKFLCSLDKPKVSHLQVGVLMDNLYVVTILNQHLSTPIKPLSFFIYIFKSWVFASWKFTEMKNIFCTVSHMMSGLNLDSWLCCLLKSYAVKLKEVPKSQNVSSHIFTLPILCRICLKHQLTPLKVLINYILHWQFHASSHLSFISYFSHLKKC